MNDNKDAVGEKIWNSWEIKSLRFIFRIFAVLFFICYVLLSLQSAWAWGQMKWVRAQDFSRLDAVIAEAEKKDDFSALVTWVGFRPLAETDALVKGLERVTSLLPGTVFNEYARRFELLKRDDEVLFWHQYARFRIRYDALRCGAPDSPDVINALQILFPNETAARLLDEDPSRVAGSIRQVLDFDAKYPARDNPAALCKALNKMQKGDYPMTPQERWADMRYTLRMVTETALEKMEKASEEKSAPERK